MTRPTKASALFFQRACRAAVSDANRRIEETLAVLDATLESMAVQTFGKPDAAAADLFAPPAEPVRVWCLHCRLKYSSALLRLEYRPRMQTAIVEMLGEESELAPLWWCQSPVCDGAGFGHDILPVPPRKHDSRAAEKKDGPG